MQAHAAHAAADTLDTVSRVFTHVQHRLAHLTSLGTVLVLCHALAASFAFAMAYTRDARGRYSWSIVYCAFGLLWACAWALINTVQGALVWYRTHTRGVVPRWLAAHDLFVHAMVALAALVVCSLPAIAIYVFHELSRGFWKLLRGLPASTGKSLLIALVVVAAVNGAFDVLSFVRVSWRIFTLQAPRRAAEQREAEQLSRRRRIASVTVAAAALPPIIRNHHGGSGERGSIKGGEASSANPPLPSSPSYDAAGTATSSSTFSSPSILPTSLSSSSSSTATATTLSMLVKALAHDRVDVALYVCTTATHVAFLGVLVAMAAHYAHSGMIVSLVLLTPMCIAWSVCGAEPWRRTSSAQTAASRSAAAAATTTTTTTRAHALEHALLVARMATVAHLVLAYLFFWIVFTAGLLREQLGISFDSVLAGGSANDDDAGNDDDSGTTLHLSSTARALCIGLFISFGCALVVYVGVFVVLHRMMEELEEVASSAATTTTMTTSHERRRSSQPQHVEQKPIEREQPVQRVQPVEQKQQPHSTIASIDPDECKTTTTANTPAMMDHDPTVPPSSS